MREVKRSIEETLIVGIGNRYRGDDAFGCIVASELAERVAGDITCIEHDGEPAGLIECWRGYDNVILIDAVSSGAAVGEIFQFDLAQQALPEAFNLYSTHAFGVPQAVELARALGKLPKKIRFVGVEAQCFNAGEALSSKISEVKESVVVNIFDSLHSQKE